MKTLHSIFHKNLIKTFLIIFILSITALLFATLTVKNDKNSFMALLNDVLMLTAAVGPLFIFFFNSNFPKNIKWLINQHFNRLELIKFFIFSQSLKILFCFLNYSLLWFILTFTKKEAKPIFSFLNFNNLYSEYFIYYILILCGIYIFYSAALFSANALDVQRAQVATTKGRKQKVTKWFVIGLICLGVLNLYDFTIPDVLKGLGWSLFVSISTFLIMNRTFKLYKPKKAYMASVIGGIIFTIPMILICFLMKAESHDQSIDYKLRAESVIYLDWLNSDFTKDEMIEFLVKADDSDYNSLLELFGRKIPINLYLHSANTKLRANKFIDFHSRRYSEKNTKLIINHMADLIETLKLDYSFAQYSYSFFIRQKVSREYIHELIFSKNDYKQLAAIYFAKNIMKKTEFQSFYRESLPLLSNEIVNDDALKRDLDRYLKIKSSK